MKIEYEKEKKKYKCITELKVGTIFSWSYNDELYLKVAEPRTTFQLTGKGRCGYGLAHNFHDEQNCLPLNVNLIIKEN